MIDTKRIVRDIRWYAKWRTTIWSTIWCAVGFFGGNVDRLMTYIPTLQYSNQEIKQKLDQFDQIQKSLNEIKNELDKPTE